MRHRLLLSGETALEKFKSPEIALTSYGGNHLEMITQFPVQLMQGRRSIDTVVLVQKGAPNDVLLGTDVQVQLGFSFMVERSDQESIDLLVGERDMALREQVGNGGPGKTGTAARMKKRGPPNGDLQVEEGHRAEGSTAGEGTTEERSEKDVMKDQIPKAAPEAVRRDGNPTRPDSNDEQVDGAHSGSVHLLQGVRILPGYQKMVQAKVSRELGKGLMLFNPKLEESNVLMADNAVEVGEETYVTLVMENYNLQPVQLDGGVQLGKLAPIEVVAREKRYYVGEDINIKRLESMTKHNDRVDELLRQLDLHLEHLTQTQQGELIYLISSYADTFALDPSELGKTHLVTHSINTGEHQPIRQTIRRTPLALRKKVNEVIQEML